MGPLQTFDVTVAEPASAGVNRHTVGARWKRSLRRHWQLYLLVILPLAYFFDLQVRADVVSGDRVQAVQRRGRDLG